MLKMSDPIPTGKKEIKPFYDREKGVVPFDRWRDKQQKVNKKLINARLMRVEWGDYSDYKSVGGGVLELRFHNGLRIYFAEIKNDISSDIVLLFGGGDKSDQQKDIERAKKYKEILDKNGLEYCLE
ncbi:hypothetical protein FACS1894152_7540 [Bacilli bacterium]|nr:hypothetical protein FACS1894152_7540 [Bacilli bacterium]